MGLLKRIAGIFGLARPDDPANDDEDVPDRLPGRPASSSPAGRGVAAGPVTAARASTGPLIARCSFGDGGVQGLRWYSKRLKIDEDGDVADEFLDEVYSDSSQVSGKFITKFAIKYIARAAVVRKQAICDGNVRQNVEFRGKLLWV